MIPPQYMSILKRWFWIIGFLGLVGAALTYLFAVSTGFGQGTSYDASATLGVSRVLSYGGSVASASSSGADSDTTATAAVALADWAKSPQFLSRVSQDLAEAGYKVPQFEIYNRISVSSDRSPGLIVVSSSGAEFNRAQQMVKSTVYVLQERAKADEDQVRTGIDGNLSQLSDDLGKRLSDIYTQLNAKTRNPGDAALRFAMIEFFGRGGPSSPTDEFAAILRDLATANNDPSLIVLLAQADALETKLGEVNADRERLSADLKRWDEPLIVVSPVETVNSEAVSRLRKRDLIAMGGMGGLVIGWAVANLAEKVRPGPASQTAPTPGNREHEWEMV